MSVTSTKTVAPGDPGVAGTVTRTGSSSRAAAMPRVDAAGIPFQVDDAGSEKRQSGGEGAGGGHASQRQRPVYNPDFGSLINRAAAFSATEPAVGHEGGPVIRVFFADVVRGVRSYEYSMRAIAANDRASGLARGSNYSRYY